MNLRLVLMFVIALTLAACGAAGDSNASSASGGGDGYKWRIAYSGDLDGEISGSIMSVVGIASSTTVAGGAMNEDLSGSAEHAFRARIMRYGEETSISFSLTLADGTRCSDSARQDDSQPSTVEVFDEASDTFRAQIEGTLYCGPERNQRIDFTAHLNADA